MFGNKKKKKELIEEETQVKELENDNVDATDSAVPMPEKEDKKEKINETPKKKIKLLGAWDKFNGYKFIIEIVATILLVTLGFLILFNREEAMFAIFLITGGVPLVTMIIRGVILIRKRKETDKKLIRFIICEFIIEFILSIAMIFAASMTIASKDPDADASIKISNWFNDTYAYWATGILYVASISYFIRTIIFKEYTDRFKFWLNIALITLALVLIWFKDNLTAWVIAIVIAIFAFLSAIVIGTDAGGGYFNYHKRNKAKSENEKAKDNDTLEAPTEESNKDINIIDIDTENSESDRIS